MSILVHDLVRNLEPVVRENLLLLKSPDKSWQPIDFLPDPKLENWHVEIKSLRIDARLISDELFSVLVGNMVTEEALPSYQTWINRIEGVGDDTGISDSPWAIWSRGWTAEENRHGDLLNRYLYLSGRVDMHCVEATIHYLIRNGFNSNTDHKLHMSLIYTSFQERATRVSHSNVGKQAAACGCQTLARICNAIAADEAKHESAYKKLVRELFQIDPESTMLAFQEMMKRKVTMPASLMEADGKKLYTAFVNSAQRSGVYTSQDYVSIMDHLIQFWNVANLSLSGEAARAQDYVCRLPMRYVKIIERMDKKPSKPESLPWILSK